MSKNKIILLALILTFTFSLHAQEKTSGILNKSEQSIGFATGIDFAILPMEFSYKRGFEIPNYSLPITLGIDLTIPTFGFDLNDSKIKITSETQILKRGQFEINAGIDPVLIKTKTKNQKMTSIGTDFHLYSGFNLKRWNTGIELSYNQIFSTNIIHTDVYKENVFENVEDGWYKNTASNIKMGLNLSYKFKKTEIFMKGGITKTGSFNDYLFVPTIYGITGINYRF